jgi:hypothetical protein
LLTTPGQTTPDAATGPQTPLVRQAVVPTPVDNTPEKPLTLRERIRNFFRGNKSDSAPATASPYGTIKQGPIVTTAPGGPSSFGQDLARPRPLPTSTVTALRPSLTAEPTDLDKAGHEKDYSWITGRLDRDGGHWVIRYAGPNEVDRFGGRLVLAGNVGMSTVHEGDLVCVVGQVVTSNRAFIGSPGSVVYQVRDINLVEPRR